ncbi:MAG TPA: DUF3006 domain-containing protein [Patescibacteria group bacterium]|nr:DUF3006 domain-containing protein [Patescibacteria group bacterium]
MKSTQTEIRIDRIEANYAVCIRNGVSFQLPISILPIGVKEGDILNVFFQGSNQRKTQERQKTKELLQKLRKKQ